MASISPTSRPAYVYDAQTDTWVPVGIGPHTHAATDVSGVVKDALVDAKGDLVVGTAADTVSRLAVGANGDTIVADSAASTGLRWQGNYAAGKNAIINGDFRIWQRGTSFSITSSGVYTADRWQLTWNGSGATRTISQQTFTPGTAPVAGYEGLYFFRYNQSVAGSGGAGNYFFQPIEDVRTFAGQNATVSFWAKADASRSVPVAFEQNFGSGGSATVSTSAGTASLTTSWTRYSYTVALPSISGKTVGSSSYLSLLFTFPANTTQTIDLWGVQVEIGSVATAFETATGTLQGELAAAMRYYYRFNATNNFTFFGLTFAANATNGNATISLPVPMRVSPTAVDTSAANTFFLQQSSGATSYPLTTAPSLNSGTNSNVGCGINWGVASGLTTNAIYSIYANNTTSAYIGFSAEL
jgi:hypothetical protein